MMTATATVTVRTTDGQAFDVEPGEIALDAALRQGIDIPYSCRSGTCRTCLSRVVRGSVEHEAEYADDLMIYPEEVADGYRLLCSSFVLEDSEVDVGW